jgi:uncharacterized protein (TIGR04255 family)
MNQRVDPPLKLAKSPLIFVLAQVKITPVLGIESKIPMLQEAFRKQGYPRLAERKIETTVRGSDPLTIQQDTRRQWEFIDKEKRASLVVDPEGLNYQVTRYDVFEAFMEAFEVALRIFVDCVDPNIVTRLGLRFVDLVIPSGGKEIRSYFNDSLRGFAIDAADERKAFFSESLHITSPEKLFVHRYAEAKSGFGFPPDLLPLQLTFPQDLRRDSPFGLLDMDHMLNREFDFSVDEIIANFWDLHKHQTKAFEASVTNEALEEWKKS